MSMHLLTQHKLVYLASPYQNYKYGTEDAFFDVCRTASYFINHGVNMFSPIAHSHAIISYGNSPMLTKKTHEFWIGMDKPYMKMADALAIAMMEGWTESRGVAEEISLFKAAGKPIYHINPINLEVHKST
jgi:hypothetical protein